MNDITTENLKNLYDRSRTFCVAKYNDLPDEIHIESDGTIVAISLPYNRDYNPKYYYFEVSSLTEDLETLIKEFQEKQALKKIEEEKYRLQREAEFKEKKDQEDRRQWEQLNKRFGK